MKTDKQPPTKGKVMKCSCKHVYQDKKYGKGMRYHNPTRLNPIPTYRCTVCTATRSPGGGTQ